MSETKVRVISALIIAPFVVACFVAYNSLVGLVASIVFLSSSELFFSTLKKYRKMGTLFFYIAIVTSYPVLYGIVFKDRPLELLSVLFITGITGTLYSVRRLDRVLEHYLMFALALIYISFNLSFFIPMYAKHGAALALLTLTLSWAFDSFAYFTGVNFGKHKISKVYSPNKSIEGVIGGIFGTVLYSFIYLWIANIFVSENIPLWYSLPFGIITGFFDTFGDLFESSIKRVYSVKHMGSIMPGHGGMLDRIDGLLFVVPIIYIFLEYF
ncbi:phosphatidate cytidylyltransferase [Thermosipho ferrireducens]|uniref:Phosphatidate cytidylyltransferase n=1 Tax=Thermosipho ferrireducens TaxID=2571116 RepID=A0ABX7S605_9BACT|nr:phosphatidate cytidylyltransferase [Thermosipho ferrireducens]QTA37251.1 phosphatidate cytidylyltransferase [Thermosipho ferrireducens]